MKLINLIVIVCKFLECFIFAQFSVQWMPFVAWLREGRNFCATSSKYHHHLSSALPVLFTNFSRFFCINFLFLSKNAVKIVEVNLKIELVISEHIDAIFNHRIYQVNYRVREIFVILVKLSFTIFGIWTYRFSEWTTEEWSHQSELQLNI